MLSSFAKKHRHNQTFQNYVVIFDGVMMPVITGILGHSVSVAKGAPPLHEEAVCPHCRPQTS